MIALAAAISIDYGELVDGVRWWGGSVYICICGSKGRLAGSQPLHFIPPPCFSSRIFGFKGGYVMHIMMVSSQTFDTLAPFLQLDLL